MPEPLIIPVIAGPTAVGKTSLSVEVAEQLGCEILSSDSRQVFRGLNIGTAKPSQQVRDRVRHHLIDELDMDAPYSAGIFVRMAEKRINEIRDRGGVPLVTGGSTLYLQALIHGLADIPSVDPALRSELNARVRLEGSEKLYRELVDVDPVYAATLDASKTQRIVRGLEVYLGTGRPLSSFFVNHRGAAHSYQLFILTRDRKSLYERIERRVDEMISDGLVGEVEELLRVCGPDALDALQTIGYREMLDHVNGNATLIETVGRIKRHSRRYAKRQLTWFRRYEGAVWYNLDEKTEMEVCQAIVAKMRDLEQRQILP